MNIPISTYNFTTKTNLYSFPKSHLLIYKNSLKLLKWLRRKTKTNKLFFIFFSISMSLLKTHNVSMKNMKQLNST